MQSAPAVPPQPERVVLTREPKKAKRAPRPLDTSNLHRPVLWAGGAITAASFMTYLMLWWAPRFGTPQWEFSTISQTIEMMPLLVVGMTMLMVGTIASGSARGAKLLAGFCVFLILMLVVMAILFGMSGLVAYSQAAQSGMPDEAKGLVLRATGKQLLMGGTYTLLFGAFAWSLWSRTKRGRAGGVAQQD